jgi:hypothetical protein
VVHGGFPEQTIPVIERLVEIMEERYRAFEKGLMRRLFSAPRHRGTVRSHAEGYSFEEST